MSPKGGRGERRGDGEPGAPAEEGNRRGNRYPFNFLYSGKEK